MVDEPTKLVVFPTATGMARSIRHQQLLAVVAVAAFVAAAAAEASNTVGLNLHHRSSSTVRRWAEARGGVQRPADGSPEYYSELSRHDRVLLARRGLAGADGTVTFAAGNETIRLSELGFLYYAEVSVGTPNVTFLLALDTGSDLLWVPCDCKQCAPFKNQATGLQFRPYSPRQSSTSKQVTCDNALCDRPNACTAATNGSCPYAVRYVSANTSSSGVLVEDVLHLARGTGDGSAALQAPVVFGCGQTQTGAFLDGGSPDGLLGLGMDKVSVPSVLAAKGLIAADSFSMCFSEDGIGRINFGDTGSPGQAETPFILRTFHPTYNVSFSAVNVGSESTPVEFTAVMDSGTSFTYLSEPEYIALTTNFNSQVREKRANFSGSLPFEYCYGFSREQTGFVLPDVSLTTSNGRAVFPVLNPIITLATQVNGRVRPVGYCLAVLRNDININIIGQNFMTGLKVVFDRQRNVLGWQEFDCYKDVGVAGSPRAAPAPTTLTPNGNDGTNRYPGAVPVPQTANSACSSLQRGLSLLPLFLLAALAI